MMRAGKKWENGERSEGGKGGRRWNKRVQEMWGVEGVIDEVVEESSDSTFALCAEIREAFQKNREEQELAKIKQMLEKGEQRLGLLEHYGTPFEKMSSIPHSYSAQNLNDGVRFESNRLGRGIE
mmetsp:Transcript_22220/g.34513  ORF Transcript_22220/g.34513 Transcript_22220/m.34513 type:complete len:124 (+) Transcript_22220:1075-1446(+)